ncbi:hypothetical protein C8A01DRAFT_12244, partial [Parachaetomium inaequale]
WMLDGELQDNASCRRLWAEEAGEEDLVLGQTGLSRSGHLTESLCSGPIPKRGTAGVCRPVCLEHLGSTVCAFSRAVIVSEQRRACEGAETWLTAVPESNVGATSGPGACCPTTLRTLPDVIAQISGFKRQWLALAAGLGNCSSAWVPPTAELWSEGIPSEEIPVLVAVADNHRALTAG